MINLRLKKRSLLAIAIVGLLVTIAQDALADGDWQQLREAVRQGDTKKVTQLIDSGVNINHQDKAGWTVLHWWNFSYDFSDRKFLETLRLLIKRGVNANAVDTRGRTALMILLVPGDDQPQSPQLEAIKILIDAGSDLHLKNEWGESAISLGLASKFKEVRAYFIKLDKASSKNDYHVQLTRASTGRLTAAADAYRSRDASRPANGAADCHPLFLGRFAPSNKRLQRTAVSASKLASPADADPQRRYAAPSSG